MTGIGPIGGGIHPVRWEDEYGVVNSEYAVQTPQQQQKLLWVEDVVMKEVDAENAQIETLRPQLKAPQNLSAQDINELKAHQETLKELYVNIERLELNALNTQRELRDMDIDRRHERLQQLRIENQELHKRFKEIMDTYDSGTKKSKVLGWIDKFTTVGCIAASVIGVCLSVATGGLSAIAAGMIAGTALAKGGTTIGMGVVKQKNQESQGQVIGHQFTREELHIAMQRTMQELKSIKQTLHQVLKMTHEMLENHQEAVIANSKLGG